MHIANPTQPPKDVFLFTLRPTRPAMLTEGATDAEREVAARHWAYSKELLAQKIIVFAGRTLTVGDDSFATVVIRSPTEADARGIMEADPAVAAGVFQAKLYPYQPMLMGEWPL